jgi:hypothetical protein
MEFPAQPPHPLDGTAASDLLLRQWLNNHKQQQQQRQVAPDSTATGVTGSCSTTSRSALDGVAGGFLTVDIACVMPQLLLELAQHQGLRKALPSMQQRHAGELEALAGFSSSSSSSSSSGGQCVLVAVEVDGPTHVAANCRSHQLGATVCRNWLLQQWGWTVLVVPWWQWQAQQDTSAVAE